MVLMKRTDMPMADMRNGLLASAGTILCIDMALSQRHALVE